MNSNTIYLSVPRKNNRISCSSDELYEDITEFWENSNYIYRNATGFIDEDINSIYDAMLFLQSSYAKDYYLRYHELVFSIPTDLIDDMSAINIFEIIHGYLAQNYQVLMVVCFSSSNTYIQGRFFINAVSPFDGSKFKDNRNLFSLLTSHLQELTGFNIELDNGVLFGKGEDNFISSY